MTCCRCRLATRTTECRPSTWSISRRHCCVSGVLYVCCVCVCSCEILAVRLAQWGGRDTRAVMRSIDLSDCRVVEWARTRTRAALRIYQWNGIIDMAAIHIRFDACAYACTLFAKHCVYVSEIERYNVTCVMSLPIYQKRDIGKHTSSPDNKKRRPTHRRLRTYEHTDYKNKQTTYACCSLSVVWLVTSDMTRRRRDIPLGRDNRTTFLACFCW